MIGATPLYFDVSQVDLDSARQALSVPKGKLVVEMAATPEKQGAIYLPEKLRDWRVPSVGMVVASGDAAYDLGDIVIVRGGDGTVRRSFSHKGYVPKGHLRFYGTYVEFTEPGETQLYDVGNSVVAKIVEGQVVPVKAHCLVLRDAVHEKTEGGLHLTARHQHRSNVGVILRVGPDCQFEKGTKVVYHPSGPINIDLPGMDPDLALMHEEAFEAILE